jgi:hypothetical protein
MTRVVFFVLAGLFCLKILWNLTVPYMIARRSFRSEGSKPKGVTLMPIVEVVLLGASVALAVPMRADWPLSPRGVLSWGALILVGSYIHLFVVGSIAGWIAQVLRKRNQ